jgi:hypothetical protein
MLSMGLASACGGSDERPVGGAVGQAGAGGGSGATVGSAGSGGAVGTAGGGGTTPGGCANNQSKATSANHIIADVSWPAKTGIEAGSGAMHIWTLTVLDMQAADPTSGAIPATGKVKPCGSTIPALTKTGIAGGGKVQTVIPDEVWDQPGIPTFTATGTLSGFDVGATVQMDPVVSLVGMTMDKADGPWPSSFKQIKALDHDGDGKPGIFARPRTDAPFGAPPTSLFEALNPNGKRATAIYVATRTKVELGGQRDTCTTASGSATVHMLDTHVVGCLRNDNKLCSDGEVDFIDQNQPKFTIKSASYKMVQLPDGASCADVRAALPN